MIQLRSRVRGALSFPVAAAELHDKDVKGPSQDSDSHTPPARAVKDPLRDLDSLKGPFTD